MRAFLAGTAGKVERSVRSSADSRLSCARGFTLVEVVLAMAFLGLVVVTLSTLLAGSLQRHGANTQRWSLLLAAQRSMENELQRLSASRTAFQEQISRGSSRNLQRDGITTVTLERRRLDAHTLRLRVVASASGKRVELETVVADRWSDTP